MKTGFVYIWFDRKHKRFYIGSHWGHEDDGYICSSRWMRNAYRRRPQDFKRRIISRVVSGRGDLLQEEHKWLQMISNEELGKKYYNLTNHLNGHWTADEEKTLSIKEKLSKKAKENHQDGEWREKWLEGISSRNNRSSDPSVRDKRRMSMLGKNVGRPKTEAYYQSRERLKGRKCSPEHIQKVREAGTLRKLNSTVVVCQHCGKTGNPGNIGRYHNDKCKHRVTHEQQERLLQQLRLYSRAGSN